MAARILVVEDDDETREAVAGALRDLGYDAAVCTDARGARAHADVDIVVTDIRMPGESGLELCAEIAGNRPDMPVILMTAFGDTRTVSLGLRAGASDFLAKPFSLSDLGDAVGRALERRQRSARVHRLTDAASGAGVPLPGVIGSSDAMRLVTDRVRQLANNRAPVLITGETGTGKELFARAIHALSERRNGPFLALNCAALSPEMIESELFGHASGAFTGAARNHPGLFRDADGGSVFLDEIGAMPLGLQSRLLRAIEQRSVRPLGTVGEVATNVRIIAASNARLRDLAASGQFRSDLLFRLSAFELDLPALRERGNDTIELAEYFLSSFTTANAPRVLSDAAKQALLAYAWPGNVRELENGIRAAVALSQGKTLEVSELPARVREAHQSRGDSNRVDLDALEQAHIERVLRETGGNRSEAARQLGIDRVTLYRKMKRYQVTA
ncbi:MAG TPA: sigma-54 dependent transcriptional regulator [Polyangiaceae bacterium]|jgi:DNA-binding NtrC family response regulator|nr:sigma-54 dependent transcriptional regulator [Polyangiaceae bacterium]